MVNLNKFKQKASAVSSLIEDIGNQLPNSEYVEELDNNYGELYSMILDVVETLDCILSDVEK